MKLLFEILPKIPKFTQVKIFLYAESTMDQHSCEYWILWPDFQEILLWKHGFKVSRIELNLNYWLYLEQYARVIIQTKFLKIFYSKSGQISRFAQISHSVSVWGLLFTFYNSHSVSKWATWIENIEGRFLWKSLF